MAKTDLTNSDIQDGFTELWLHYLWSEGKLGDGLLSTREGKQLRVLFPGWYNKGWGPDFVDARILVDDDELFGDIEIHKNESAWYGI